MRCVAAFVRRNTLPDIAGDASLVRFYSIPDFCRVALVDQLADRIMDKIRIAKKTVSVGKGVAHRLDFVVQRLRRSPTLLAERISLQDVQHLADGNTARAGWRGRDHVIGTVIALNGRELAGLVVLQIFLIDDSSAGPARLDDGRGGLAPVEAVNALPSDQTQGIGK